MGESAKPRSAGRSKFFLASRFPQDLKDFLLAKEDRRLVFTIYLLAIAIWWSCPDQSRMVLPLAKGRVIG